MVNGNQLSPMLMWPTYDSYTQAYVTAAAVGATVTDYGLGTGSTPIAYAAPVTLTIEEKTWFSSYDWTKSAVADLSVETNTYTLRMAAVWRPGGYPILISPTVGSEINATFSNSSFLTDGGSSYILSSNLVARNTVQSVTGMSPPPQVYATVDPQGNRFAVKVLNVYSSAEVDATNGSSLYYYEYNPSGNTIGYMEGYFTPASPVGQASLWVNGVQVWSDSTLIPSITTSEVDIIPAGPVNAGMIGFVPSYTGTELLTGYVWDGAIMHYDAQPGVAGSLTANDFVFSPHTDGISYAFGWRGGNLTYVTSDGTELIIPLSSGELITFSIRSSGVFTTNSSGGNSWKYVVAQDTNTLKWSWTKTLVNVQQTWTPPGATAPIQVSNNEEVYAFDIEPHQLANIA
ncbi:MAG: hypothetical protein ACYDBH_00500 [Acidobacteriaceae bacterium]